MGDLDSALGLLAGQSELSLIMLFWYTIVFDVPRYASVFASLSIGQLLGDGRVIPDELRIDPRRISVIIIGHNERDVLERCVRSLREQSICGFEIVIVSDGSSDGMSACAGDLVRRGLADRALATQLRSGKPAGINLAIAAAKGDIIVQVDCDCSFDRFAVERIVAPFVDHSIGATSGDIFVRNGRASLIAAFQGMEYLLSISVGKRFDDALGLVKCISGAFGAFRRQAVDQVCGYDALSGEDLDITLRLREAGWRIVFVPDAVCYTDVPTTLWALFRQRMRWEGDAVRLRFRRHIGLMSPTSVKFSFFEAIHQWEFLFFSVIGAAMLPIYTAWLFLAYGTFAIAVLIAMEIALCALNVVLLLLAAIITRRDVFFRNLLYVPGYTVFNSYAMRAIRLIAYCSEWFGFRAVQHDNHSPAKVRMLHPW